ncbi:MAG TPA: BatD family protein [Candidatus Acidoferrum sp.]|nr:BatD family protein [Candidatus Acidoferrum sp.]
MDGWLKNKFVHGAFMVLAALSLGVARSGATTFTASLDRDTIALGESATLALTFEGSQPKGTPQITSVPGLQIAYVGPSSQFSFINGQTSSTITYHFSVAPTHVGIFTIPGMTAMVDGQPLTCQPLKLTVTQPNAPPAQAINSGSEIAFMKLTLPKEKVYAGEVLAARLDIYLRDDVRNFANFHFTATPAEGVAVGKMVEGGRQQVQIGSRLYTDIPLSLVLNIVKSGPVSVGPFTADALIVLPSANRQRDPFFGQFPDAFGMFGGEQKQITLATETLNLVSQPLPAEDRPANFNGAVGQFSMAVSAGPTNVAVGDPITVRIQISGRGTLDSVLLPDQPAWRDFKTFPPTQNLKTSDALGLQGTKTFEQIVAPQNTDIRELPAFSFSYFDPEAGTYRTLAEPPVQLAVQSAGATPNPVIAPPNTPNTPAPPPRDILPIKEQLGTLVRPGAPLLMRPGFLVAQGLPVLAWLAAVVWRKRADHLANNPRLRRQRYVAQLLREGMAELRRFAAENKSDDFFATLFRLLQEQLGERLDCPASSITEAVIDERLVRLGAPETTLTGLRELFQLCNQARYAPLRTSGELAAVIPQFENAVRGVQEVRA